MCPVATVLYCKGLDFHFSNQALFFFITIFPAVREGIKHINATIFRFRENGVSFVTSPWAYTMETMPDTPAS